TAADFMVDLVGGPKSPWNVSAGRVFTDYFIEKTGRDDMPEMRKAVEKAFTNRVKSLKSQWKKDALSQTAKAAERSKHSRKQRKYQLFQRRRETAKLYSPLGRHIDVLDALGVDGMSSDESSFDPHTSQPIYTLVKPSWRHPDLHDWLKVFDQLHHRNHVNSWSLDKRGAFTHIRAGSQKIRQTVHAPPHLPVNAYDPKWLESRETLYVRHVLCPKDPHRFDHPPDVIA
ncbi:hypothetical protein BJY52DRAFT_1130363, partial [Lactarius psammicola]